MKTERKHQETFILQSKSRFHMIGIDYQSTIPSPLLDWEMLEVKQCY
jgi:hypothetical protein